MSVQNKAASRRFRESLDKGNFAVMDEMLAPNLVAHMAGMPAPLNREAIKALLGAFYSAFPDLRHTIEDVIAEGDKVALRITLRGTHTGDFQGIPPTGKQIAMSGTVIDRIAGGKLVEHWANLDQLGMLQQLGVIPKQG